MNNKVTFDYSAAKGFINDAEIKMIEKLAETAKSELLNKTGAGNDFLGWIDLPVNYDREEFSRIQAAAKKIQQDSEVLLVIGIGGSYLGARAAVEALQHSFYNVLPKENRGTPQIIFVGNNISSTYMRDVIDLIEGKDFSINVISKSGTTTEPAIALRIFRKLLEEKYGKEEGAKRIYATTDQSKGALKTVATEEGFETFVIPDDVGGRYSVLTAVGLLPIAVSGAINWGLIGFFQFDLVASLFGGQGSIISRIIYSLVGIAGLINLGLLFKPSQEVVREPEPRTTR